MEYWQGVLSRLSIPGVALMAMGALLTLDAKRLSNLVWKQGGDRAVMPLKVAGLVMALLGALILLDIIPM